ncbi:uncharacterized protein LOC105262572 isoform X2 [Musca domestica]|uniref:Uncharacterized protein LOC105262572 isoform X2 n=1 Tax=Musca domestica TaxID=7370 RepID=A0ABM3V4U1_MUSDO|nr:uncharacterized protein LOC105262572 isoform X2 [Musca domestica]XP_058980800.1 uncharacterized protein LOC105262572 isoform X2 [Musca domestica]XP_058980801.1 uncharacterized protein LOC105262572 isoform X2 [Musca domestica]XP_058980802.1 uncharacterized protein LOC105262572 isoform X2 [Musca domestica]XP_058980803.1 uncharacterized protein LOC105262572 isoform X2 [Musca domestica]
MNVDDYSVVYSQGNENYPENAIFINEISQGLDIIQNSDKSLKTKESNIEFRIKEKVVQNELFNTQDKLITSALNNTDTYATLTPLQTLPPISTMSEKFLYGSQWNEACSIDVSNSSSDRNDVIDSRSLSFNTPINQSHFPKLCIRNITLQRRQNHNYADNYMHSEKRKIFPETAKSILQDTLRFPVINNNEVQNIVEKNILEFTQCSKNKEDNYINSQIVGHSNPIEEIKFIDDFSSTKTVLTCPSLKKYPVTPPPKENHKSISLKKSNVKLGTDCVFEKHVASTSLGEGANIEIGRKSQFTKIDESGNSFPLPLQITGSTAQVFSDFNEESFTSSTISNKGNKCSYSDLKSDTISYQAVPSTKLQDEAEDREEINTKDLAQRISSELKRYSIPQAIFAQRVLCRSQGTLSDLLRNPKPWSKLKSGRETFRRMLKWLQEPEMQRMSSLRLAAAQEQRACTFVNSKQEFTRISGKITIMQTIICTPKNEKYFPRLQNPFCKILYGFQL